MGMNKANELLQDLVSNLNMNWTGKKKFTTEDAYKLIIQIYNEIKDIKIEE